MLNKLCSDFAENRSRVRKVFRMESTYIYPVCANIFCARGMVADPDRLKDCKQLLREKTGLFSNFRGTVQAPVACMLATASGAENRMERAVYCYKLLKERFWGSQYLALVAFLMADLTTEARAAEKVSRGRDIYDSMKQEHPFLTSAEDSIFAVLMAFSEQSDDALIADMEQCYSMLMQRFHSRNAVQSASHVLSLLPGTPEEKTERMIRIYDGLRARGRKYGRQYELASLAAVAGLDQNVETLVEEILEADRLLSGQKGYGVLGMGRQIRLMHAAMLVSDLYTPRSQVDTAAMAGTISLIAAQQAAMCAVIVSSTTAASSASSH